MYALLEKNSETSEGIACKPCLRKLENDIEVLRVINELLSLLKRYFGCEESDLQAIQTSFVPRTHPCADCAGRGFG